MWPVVGSGLGTDVYVYMVFYMYMYLYVCVDTDRKVLDITGFLEGVFVDRKLEFSFDPSFRVWFGMVGMRFV